LGQIKGNLINNSDFFKVRNFCCGRPFWILTPGAKKPSYTTA